MRSKGKIASWNDDKGYGFITPADGGSRVFVHVKAFSNRNQRPAIDDVVTYAVAKDKQGRPRAESATLAGGKFTWGSSRHSGVSVFFVALFFLSGLGVSVYATDLPLLILEVYLALSIVTFIVYAIDKSAARNGRWRTSEATLHLLSLVGGWPGALVAQQTLRHKSKKTSFRVVLWITVLLNCAVIAWLHTSDGRTRLDQLLAKVELRGTVTLPK